jgi:glycosyltransferase involved in cell wall biosynthesis
MTTTPLVSILAVSYNHEDWVIETLDSIRHQTYGNIQLVIIDDCSTDNTVPLIEAWLIKHQVDCIFIAHKTNQGICKTYNEGVHLCEGEYYSTLSCDDVLLPIKTEKQLTFFEKQPKEVGMIYSDAKIIHTLTGDISPSFIEAYRGDKKKPSGNIFNDLIEDNFIPAMSTLVRKAVFIELQGFDENLIFEDYDFFLRISHKHSVIYLDEVFVDYKIHGNNFNLKMHNISGYHWSLVLIYQKHATNSKTANKKLINLFDQLTTLREQQVYIEQKERDIKEQQLYIEQKEQGIQQQQLYIEQKELDIQQQQKYIDRKELDIKELKEYITQLDLKKDNAQLGQELKNN